MLRDIDERDCQHIALLQVACRNERELGGAGAERRARGRLARVHEVRRDGVERAADLALRAIRCARLLDILRAGSGHRLEWHWTSDI